MGIPCSLYIDDRHNGQLQTPPKQVAYASYTSLDEHNLATAKSAILIPCRLLFDQIGIFSGVAKILPDAV